MKKYSFRVIALLCLLVMVIGALPASAAAYKTYTYSIDSFSLPSPDAYTPEQVVDSLAIGLEVALNAPTDIEVDSAGNVYIADPNNNRIVVLDKYYQYKFEISTFINDQAVDDALTAPQGVFIWEGTQINDDGTFINLKEIYVADTQNYRLVVFNENGEFLRQLEAPTSDVFEEGDAYTPIALAVDSAGRIYVVSSSAYQGIIALTADGEFAGYLGAQKVAYNAFEMIWRQFMSDEQLATAEKNVSEGYNNIAIDDEGFIYITANQNTEESVQALADSIASGDATYAPVKKLNTAGDDIMRRNGFFIPAGEINFVNAVLSTDDRPAGPSTLVDVALGPEETWSVIDQKRSKIYTYDNNGELLFIFGDTGSQLGNLNNAVGIVYSGDKMLVLDSVTSSFTVYKCTEYGKLLLTAIKHNNELQYSKAVEDWENILQRNNNFDAAYIGLGQAYYRQGNWELAMQYFQDAYDVENYSTAFGMQRKDWISGGPFNGAHILLIIAVVVGVILIYYFFFKYAGKVNKAAATSGKKKTYKEELLYATHVIFHPFDGFWDLKHEKRGSLRGALTILLLAVVCFAYNAVGQSYIFNPMGGYGSIFGQLSGMLVPLLLFVTANWCLTTLFDGEGSFKDIFIACCYSMTPIILIIPMSTLLTHVVTNNEVGFITLLNGVCYVWLFALMIFGVMVTHDYSLGKNLITIIGSIVCMAVIMFVLVLFTSLLGDMASFVNTLVEEITYRM